MAGKLPWGFLIDSARQHPRSLPLVFHWSQPVKWGWGSQASLHPGGRSLVPRDMVGAIWLVELL
jgi:hypothetical protein